MATRNVKLLTTGLHRLVIAVTKQQRLLFDFTRHGNCIISAISWS
jgi:hypothetical protein